jgi:hypothetical protein
MREREGPPRCRVPRAKSSGLEGGEADEGGSKDEERERPPLALAGVADPLAGVQVPEHEEPAGRCWCVPAGGKGGHEDEPHEPLCASSGGWVRKGSARGEARSRRSPLRSEAARAARRSSSHPCRLSHCGKSCSCRSISCTRASSCCFRKAFACGNDNERCRERIGFPWSGAGAMSDMDRSARQARRNASGTPPGAAVPSLLFSSSP